MSSPALLHGDKVEFAPVIADLFWSAGPAVFSHLFRNDPVLWQRLCEPEWYAVPSIFSRSHSVVAKQESEIVGVINYLPAKSLVGDTAATLSRFSRSLDQETGKHVGDTMDLLNWLFPPAPDDALFIYLLAVSPTLRGRGIGKDLLVAAEDVGRREGMRSVHLDTDITKPAVGFYERRGYETVVETRVPELRGVNPHFRMVKKLT